MVSPPGTLVKSFWTTPSSTASTGVPRGARMSIASCTRPPRISLKLSRSWLASTPCTGRATLRALRRAKSLRSGGGAGRAWGGVGTSGTASGASAWGAHGAGVANGVGVASNTEAAEDGAEAAKEGDEGEANRSDGVVEGVTGSVADGVAAGTDANEGP